MKLTTAARRAKAEIRRYYENPYDRMRLRGRLLEPWWRKRFAHFGEGSMLVDPLWLNGPHKISVGEDTTIFPDAWLSAEKHVWNRPEPSLTIGARVTLRQRVTISCANRVAIADDAGISGGVLMMDSDHTWDGGNPQINRNPLSIGQIQVGRGSMIGENSVILRDTIIGKFCIIGSLTVLRDVQIPDYSIVVGSPGRIVGSTYDRLPPNLREI